jgi:predicted DNA binding CopG/RHH family protein
MSNMKATAKKSPGKKARPILLTLRLSSKEYDALLKLASKRGLSMSSLLRTLVMEKTEKTA